MTRRWPFPADSPVDRARRVAASYRAAAEAAGADVPALDRHFAGMGEGWIGGAVVVDDQDLVTASEAQELLGVPADRVRQWRARGQLVPVGSGPSRYRVADVRAVTAAMRTRRR